MKIYENRRVKRSYSPTGPMARAALDFAVKYAMYYDFPPEFRACARNDQHLKVIEMFEDRQATEAVFSFLVPESRHGRQIFTIHFAPTASGRSPWVEIEIKSVEELRARAKLYPRDASAYAGTRKPKRQAGAIDKTL